LTNIAYERKYRHRSAAAFNHNGKAVKVQDINRELRVVSVLEGSVRKSDREVRITAQLVLPAPAIICGPNVERPTPGYFLAPG
jgi:hypothetical protein